MKKVIKDIFVYVWKGLSLGAVCFLGTFIYVYFDLISKEGLDSLFDYYLRIMFSAAVILVSVLTAYYVFIYFIYRKKRPPLWIMLILSCAVSYLIYFSFIWAAGIPFDVAEVLKFTAILLSVEALVHLFIFLDMRHRKELAKKLNELIKLKKTDA